MSAPFKLRYERLLEFLRSEYGGIDFESDPGVANKINELLWILAERTDNPERQAESKTPQASNEPAWRKW
jgi:hypothetical protein